jgi:ssDNA-binding Zn-finger/Zn-ribbon topoisomerase 1
MEATRISTECPRCGDDLVVRHNRRNGNPFLGCDSYPACSFSEPYVTALHDALDEFKRQQARASAPPKQSPRLEEISRRVREAIIAVHPDKWGDHPASTEATKLLLDLRDFVTGQEARDA